VVQLPIQSNQSNAPPLQTLPLPLPGPAAKPAHPAGHTFTFTHCLVLSVYPTPVLFLFFYPFLLASSWTAGGASLTNAMLIHRARPLFLSFSLNKYS